MNANATSPKRLDDFLNRLEERDYGGDLNTLDPAVVQHIDLSILATTDEQFQTMAKEMLRLAGKAKAANLVPVKPWTSAELKEFNRALRDVKNRRCPRCGKSLGSHPFFCSKTLKKTFGFIGETIVKRPAAFESLAAVHAIAVATQKQIAEFLDDPVFPGEFPNLPDDLRSCLQAGCDSLCGVRIVGFCLWTDDLSRGALQSETSRATAYLRASLARLRELLPAVEIELSASAEGPVGDDRYSGPSAHHHALEIGRQALDHLALRESGAAYYLSGRQGEVRFAGELLPALSPDGAALSLDQLPDPTRHVPSLQREACRAARARGVRSPLDGLVAPRFALASNIERAIQSVPRPPSRRGRKENPTRDAEILRAVESGEFSSLLEVGKSFGNLSRSAVSKAATRARKARGR